jgi:transposase-like protein
MDQKQSRPACGVSREAYYRGLFAEQEASGQSLRAFARERGLSPFTLYAWRGKLGRTRRRREEGGGLVAVELLGGRRSGEDSASSFEVVLSDGCRVRVPRDIQTQRLAEVVAALRSC